MSDLFEDLDQQRAAGEEHDAEALIRSALDLVQTAKAMPLSASVLVSRDELAELLQAALDRMPDELRQARWLLKERDEFLAEKAREADDLLEEVRVQAERMVQRTEIVRQANHVAQRILDDANEEARRLRHEAEDYADQKLASFEIVLDRTMKTVQAGREKLQVTPLPKVEIGEGGRHLAGPASARRAGRASMIPKASSTRTSTEPASGRTVVDPPGDEPVATGPRGAGGRTPRRPGAARRCAGEGHRRARARSRLGAGRRRRSMADLTLASYPGGIMVPGTVTAPWRASAAGAAGRSPAPWRPPSASGTPRRWNRPDEDAYLLDGDELDLEPLARDAVLLDLPLAPLCSPDCRGLVPPVRQNWNVAPAPVTPEDDPRWAALDALRARRAADWPRMPSLWPSRRRRPPRRRAAVAGHPTGC